ncbi:MAG: mechanosensitive ion channel domain-containing protein [Naasia sp.]
MPWTTNEFFWSEALANVILVVIILVVAVVVRVVLAYVIKRVVERVVSGVKKRQRVDDTQALSASPVAAVRTVQRARTLGDVLNNIVTVAISVIAVLSVVFTLAPGITGAFSLITAALGAGLGFGAQNIVKDVLNGLFMVIEDQLGVGDVVDTGQATGVVESVGIRITQIRDVNGTLWYVRNGEIVRVGNMSQGWARVIIDLAVPYDADIDAVQDRMLSTANELASSPKWRSMVMERPEIWGLESISSEALVVRIVIKTRTSARDDVARELRLRLKNSLDSMGVKLPALNTVVLSGMDGATSVRGARPPKTHPIPTREAPAETPKKPRLPRVRKPRTTAPGSIPLPPSTTEAPGSTAAPRPSGSTTKRSSETDGRGPGPDGTPPAPRAGE